LGFELFIATRYLQSRRKEQFISFISLISILGIVIGVGALDFVLSMMNGFEREIRGRIIATTAHISVSSLLDDGFANWQELANEVESVEGVVATAPNVFYKTVIGSQEANEGIFVKGIIPREEMQVSRLADNIIAGDLYLGDPNDTLPGIVLGRDLASTMRVAINDEVVLASLRSKKLTVVLQPKYKRFQVTGIFETGMNEYDANLAYISIEAAQDLFNLENMVSGLQVKVTDIYDSRNIAERIREKLGSLFRATDWSERHKNLFGWMTLEKYGMSIVVGLIVAVAAFNIISTLIMLVLEKRRDIAILKSMGATRRQVMKIFVFKGTILGAIGSVLGTGLGYFLCWLQQTFELVAIPGEIYFINVLPIDMRFWEFSLIAAVSLLISFLATIYPSLRAARLYPVDILRLG
jgi:lipoprotein-releasing system permease protein